MGVPRRPFHRRIIPSLSLRLSLPVLLSMGTIILIVLVQSNIVSADPHAGNRTTNWSFEEGFGPYLGGEVANNWTPFVIGENVPSFRDTSLFNPGFVEKIHGATSQMIWADGPAFTAGVYQKINVTPGAAYLGFYCTASVGGATRTVGIDPYGGTDPQACSVVWGTSYSANGGWATIELGTAPKVRVVAQASQITLFVKVISDGGMKQTFIDAVELTPDFSASAAANAPSGTPTTAPYSVYAPFARAFYQDQSCQPTNTSVAGSTSTPTSTPTSTSTPSPTGNAPNQ